MKSRMGTLSAAVSAMALAVAAPGAGAVDVGVGVSLNNVGSGSGGYGVSVPLRFGNITVEPDLSFYDFTSDTTYPSLPTDNSSSDNSQFALETGVYWRQQMVPSLEMYVGGRVGYSQNDNSTAYAAGTTSKVTEEGFYLGPTLGAEYFFNPHFSLGLDVSLLFGSFSAEYSTNGVVTTERDTDRVDYQTRAKLRFYF